MAIERARLVTASRCPGAQAKLVQAMAFAPPPMPEAQTQRQMARRRHCVNSSELEDYFATLPPPGDWISTTAVV